MLKRTKQKMEIEKQKKIVARNRKLKALSDWQFWRRGGDKKGIIFFF